MVPPPPSQGREYRDVRNHLLPLWRASLRAIDDIKDSVREAGEAGESGQWRGREGRQWSHAFFDAPPAPSYSYAWLLPLQASSCSPASAS